jgi:hypothetical protein
VPHRLLAAVAGRDDDTLVAILRTAVADQLLVTKPGEDGYEFRHALLREVVEADLLPGERTRLHAAYAKALAERPELAGALPAVARRGRRVQPARLPALRVVPWCRRQHQRLREGGI